MLIPQDQGLQKLGSMLCRTCTNHYSNPYIQVMSEWDFSFSLGQGVKLLGWDNTTAVHVGLHVQVQMCKLLTFQQGRYIILCSESMCKHKRQLIGVICANFHSLWYRPRLQSCRHIIQLSEVECIRCLWACCVGSQHTCDVCVELCLP